eukprot:CAMPEP_0195539896 /NCGR_PEP_ID=MMETSP0794_2-20130614/50295_1 /TAXON_ID=515487 /ORGANISM="Stephanopyxis turris, Strain CCMP 815" /LENGTH=748 /DNA_ID=CAMNT_0040673955 /DNA_START=67 /DNA_END=2310 /DNA_ORIENTATION=+
MENTTANRSTGKDGCPCIDASKILASHAKEERSCETPEFEGVRVSGSCFPFSYGSNVCLPHNLLLDPICKRDPPIPRFCEKSWCYVDLEKCRNSPELVHRSDWFPLDSDLFYSYSTCDSTGSSLEYLEYIKGLREENVLKDMSITVTIPNYNYPFMYKRNPTTGDIISRPGEEYFNDNIPFEGAYIDYMNDIAALSNGDIKKLNYTHRSKGSDTLHPSSKFTAAVQDVGNGLSDMATGPFWITEERLRITSFTIPFMYDKTVLVVKRPRANTSLSYQVSKVLKPFDHSLWYVVVTTILLSGFLSAWFSKPSRARLKMRSFNWKNENLRHRAKLNLRLVIDAILEKGVFFFGGAVEQDSGASLPHKLLMFGYAFFILVTVSAYVANLAAFLTLPGVSKYVDTMQGAINSGSTICAHPVLRSDLEFSWPHAKFVFAQADKKPGVDGATYFMLDLYDAGKCDMLAVSLEGGLKNEDLVNKFCERDLVFTNGLVVETPMAFPIRTNLAAGFSYWMHKGEKNHGITLTNAIKQYTCSVELSVTGEPDDLAPLSVENMFLAFAMYAVFATAAIATQLAFRWRENTANISHALAGRASVLIRTNRREVFARTKNKGDGDDQEYQPSFRNGATDPDITEAVYMLVELSVTGEPDDLAPLSVENMFLAFAMYAVFATAAIATQLAFRWRENTANISHALAGRASVLIRTNRREVFARTKNKGDGDDQEYQPSFRNGATDPDITAYIRNQLSESCAPV